jgi:hypothetical protein
MSRKRSSASENAIVGLSADEERRRSVCYGASQLPPAPLKHLFSRNRWVAYELERRNKIVIRNRKGIERMAGAAYGTPEKEYRRLIG